MAQPASNNEVPPTRSPAICAPVRELGVAPEAAAVPEPPLPAADPPPEFELLACVEPFTSNTSVTQPPTRKLPSASCPYWMNL